MATKALEDELARCAREYETVSRSLTDIRARLERTSAGALFIFIFLTLNS